MSEQIYHLPDLGEGLTEATVLEWRVAVGDEVALNQPVAVVETAKAAVELPSPVVGRVTRLAAGIDEVIEVGAPLLYVDSAGGPSPAGTVDSAPAVPADAPVAAEATSAVPEPALAERVGSEVSESVPAAVAVSEAPDEDTKILVGVLSRADLKVTRRRPRRSDRPAGDPRFRSPVVRALARRRGVHLSNLVGTGERGEITRADVERAAAAPAGAAQAAAPRPQAAREAVAQRPDGVRRLTAERMLHSSNEFATATITTTVSAGEVFRLVAQYKDPDADRVDRITPLAVISRAVIVSLGEHPTLNSSWEPGAEEILRKPFVNLGMAVDSPRGLLVPSVKDADLLNLRQLASGINVLVEAARLGRATTRDLTGSTFTITNIGAKANVELGTPLLNPPEAAILALGRINLRPWVVDGAVVAERVLPMSLSVDHRVIDGAAAGAFLDRVAYYVEHPLQLLS